MLPAARPPKVSEWARGVGKKDAKAWDKVLALALALGAGSIPLVARLDARIACGAGPFHSRYSKRASTTFRATS